VRAAERPLLKLFETFCLERAMTVLGHEFRLRNDEVVPPFSDVPGATSKLTFALRLESTLLGRTYDRERAAAWSVEEDG
jgi:hypothetical protein